MISPRLYNFLGLNSLTEEPGGAMGMASPSAERVSMVTSEAMGMAELNTLVGARARRKVVRIKKLDVGFVVSIVRILD
jgi:hypothetical protein